MVRVRVTSSMACVVRIMQRPGLTLATSRVRARIRARFRLRLRVKATARVMCIMRGGISC